MTKRTLEEVQAEIDAVTNELNNVHGNETEVYARIVGYYRAVRNWNKGKRDEFYQRKLFNVESCSPVKQESTPEVKLQELHITENKQEVKKVLFEENNDYTYQLFTRPGCPHCPPVKSYIKESLFSGNEINVDTEEGLNTAAELGVFSTPTVILFNTQGQEVVRAHNVEELEAIISGIKEKSIA